MADVIIVGGGVIGLSIAWELAGQGATVQILEQGGFGREASWAGAGILPPGNPQQAHTAEQRLRAHSHVRWPGWSRELRDATGIDNGFRPCGGLEVRRPGGTETVAEAAAAWRAEGVEVEPLTPAALRALEPALHPEITSAHRLPQVSQVRNPRHVKALIAACAARGVELLPGRPVIDFEEQGGRVRGVRTLDGRYEAERVCVAGGSWTGRLLERVGLSLPIEPVRGQIVLLSLRAPLFRHVVEVGKRYLVPRPDGRVLVGATEERAGFDKQNTAGAVAELIRFAVDLVPGLAGANVERTWAGLRPGSPDGLPYLGAVPGLENLFVAAGHFRAGLQLSPITAVLMRQVILRQEPVIPVEPYACARSRPACAGERGA